MTEENNKIARSDKEIEAEIKKLEKLSNLTGRWNVATKEILHEQWAALCDRATHELVKHSLYEDETAEGYKEGDNDLWQAVDEAVSWMNGEKGYEAPSETA